MSVSTIGLFPNMQKDKVRDCLPDILALLQKYGLKTLLPEDMKDFKAAGYYSKEAESLAQMEAGISLGGDGTFLQMARHLSPLKIPVFGVNFGKLGFLAETEMSDFEKALQKLAGHEFELEERSQLKASVVKNGLMRLMTWLWPKGIFPNLRIWNLKLTANIPAFMPPTG